MDTVRRLALIPGLLTVGAAMQFVPPDSAQRSAALGDLSGLPGTLRRALEPGTNFQPMGMPGAADWLANHIESGQTFEEYVKSRPNRPDRQRRRIYLQPLGDLSTGGGPPIDKLVEFASAFFGLETAALPVLELKSLRVTKRRNPYSGQEQILTTDVLALLRSRLPKDAFALIGITMIDL